MSRITHKLKSFLGKGPPEHDGIMGSEIEPDLSGPATEVQQLLEQNRGAEALKLAQQLLEENGHGQGLHYLVGTCLDQVGRHEEALAAYRHELSLHPNHAKARERVAALSQALANPSTPKIPFDQRRWNTSLPRPTLLRIQQSLHNYTYRDVPMQKNPFDIALYPMLVWSLKPRTIIEIGSKSGGSALWFGDLLTGFGIDGRVCSIDIVRVDSVTHPRVTFFEGDGRALGKSLGGELLKSFPRPWLVIEDADHAYETSAAVLRFFHPWLRPGEFIVVEDGIISDISEDAACNSGPHRALKEFLKAHASEYEIAAEYCDFFGHNMTWCTNGFLRKL